MLPTECMYKIMSYLTPDDVDNFTLAYPSFNIIFNDNYWKYRFYQDFIHVDHIVNLTYKCNYILMLLRKNINHDDDNDIKFFFHKNSEYIKNPERDLYFRIGVSGNISLIEYFAKKIHDNLSKCNYNRMVEGACSKRDINSIMILVKTCKDSGYYDEVLKTAMRYTARNGYNDILQILIEKISTSTINFIKRPIGDDQNGYLNRLMYKIKLYLDDVDDLSSVFIACIEGNQNHTLKYLLHKELLRKETDISWYMCINKAIETNNIKAVKLLIDYVDIDVETLRVCINSKANHNIMYYFKNKLRKIIISRSLFVGVIFAGFILIHHE